MFLFEVDAEHRLALLRAMRSVALHDGEETPQERTLLAAVRAALEIADDLEVTPLNGPEELSSSLRPEERERIVQAMLLMAVMDGSGHPGEAALIEGYARRLGVDEPRVTNLRQLAEGRLLHLRWDLTRKGYARDEMWRTAREEGLAGLYRTFGPLVGMARDADRVRRFNDLGLLPEGTLGRAYWRFIVEHDLGFPGEAHAVAERGMWHDLSHVLGGYGTTPEDEAAVVSFIAGYRREDPFFWLFTIALQFQVGLRLSPFSPATRLRIDPARMVRHHRRGAALSRDLSAPWDHWAQFARPLEEVRRELNVLPLEELTDGPH